MKMQINNPVNLLRLAKFLAKTVDRILDPNFGEIKQIPVELLEIRDVIAQKLPNEEVAL